MWFGTVLGAVILRTGEGLTVMSDPDGMEFRPSIRDRPLRTAGTVPDRRHPYDHMTAERALPHRPNGRAQLGALPESTELPAVTNSIAYRQNGRCPQ
jgi:hypothetical protein